MNNYRKMNSKINMQCLNDFFRSLLLKPVQNVYIYIYRSVIKFASMNTINDDDDDGDDNSSTKVNFDPFPNSDFSQLHVASLQVARLRHNLSSTTPPQERLDMH
jgi:hypothetical protein